MAHTYIGKALAAISRLDVDKSEWAAARIHSMSAADVKRLESDLDYGLLSWKMRGVEVMGGSSRTEIADWRRGAQLMQKFSNQALTADFDESQCKGIIRAAGTGTFAPPVGGYYLKPSALAFASSSERAALKAGWEEGVDALRFAYQTAMWARHGGDAACTALVRKWFGTGDIDAVVEVLAQTLRGTATYLVGVCYQGLGAAVAAGWPLKLKERAGGMHAEEAGISGPEWGWSAPRGAQHQAIGFGSKLFNDNTRLRMVRAHDVTSREMGVTRGGAFAHELTHRFAQTVDVDVPNAVYVGLGRAVPASEAARAKGYGPFTCAGLGAHAPDLAVTNADNYRLFCEDAIYAKPFV
jgi:hypothetical protein